jgi:DNA-binding NtrC family response regulator
MTHVVHLEDDGPLRDILKLAFEAFEPEINLRQFENSDETLAYIEQHRDGIELYILDIRVPGTMNGLQVAEKIRELKCPGVVVITSAYSKPSNEFLASLSCEWFPKPWHIMETMQKLFQITTNRRGQM